MLHQLNSQQLSWSVKSCQLCGKEIRWWTEQLSVGITRMSKQLQATKTVADCQEGCILSCQSVTLYEFKQDIVAPLLADLPDATLPLGKIYPF